MSSSVAYRPVQHLERFRVVAPQDQPHRGRLDRDAQVVDVDDVLLGELHHEGAAPRFVVDQPFGGEQQQRVPDRPAADAELLGQPRLDEPVAAGHPAGGDQLPDGVGCLDSE